jgi:hypothetical protein
MAPGRVQRVVAHCPAKPRVQVCGLSTGKQPGKYIENGIGEAAPVSNDLVVSGVRMVLKKL